jgi:hypothetical protein
VPADVELPGIVTQNHGVAQKFVRMNAAPQCPFGGDPDRVGRDLQRVEVSRITLFDGPGTMQIDGLPTSASRLL